MTDIVRLLIQSNTRTILVEGKLKSMYTETDYNFKVHSLSVKYRYMYMKK